MPRITKKMKIEELSNLEKTVTESIKSCMGFSVNSKGNIVDEYGKVLMITVGDPSDEGNRKFLKDGDGPFKYRERKFDPINNFKLTIMLFNDFIAYMTKEYEDDKDNYLDDSCTVTWGQFFNSITTISLKDVEIEGILKKYVEIGSKYGNMESEIWDYPTFGYIEIMLSIYSPDLVQIVPILKRIEELKNELEC